MAAARRILSLGPKALIVKKGEYGALMISRRWGGIRCPGLSAGERQGSRRARATPLPGGFLGFLAMTGDFRSTGIRKAMIHGSVIASFTVEDFSVNRLLAITERDIQERYQHFQRLTFFEHTCMHADDCQRIEFAWSL